MSQELKGNTRGLAPSELRRLERLFERRIDSREIVSLELAREVATLAQELRRRIGLLISREGKIEEVFIGTHQILYLPDLGRYRLGLGRLRRLRLIFSDLSQHHADKVLIPTDIFTDLQKLRLDAVIGVKVVDNHVRIAYAHLLPLQATQELPYMVEQIPDLGRLELDFLERIQSIEQDLDSQQIKSVSRGPQAVLIGVYDKSERDPESRMAELVELTRTAGVEVLDKIIQRRTPDPKTLLGKGKLEEVVLRCLALGAELIIFDGELRPGQWRVITNSTELKVLDRSMLILDVFAKRATSSDGRIQVELAQLKYRLPRLVEEDTGLSRLTGGIGGQGPGETKLEISRRRIRDRIADLERRIGKLGEQRELRRRRGKENYLPVISLIGYTNVGKSTLFNALTKSSVLTEDKLFATLDPARRRVALPWPDEVLRGEVLATRPAVVVISDTVGFIRDLPAELMSAFKATLEELGEADLLLHVVDAGDAELSLKRQAVEEILKELNFAQIPSLLVLNKTDRLEPVQAQALAHELGAVPVSGLARQGLPELLKQVSAALLVNSKKAASV